MVRERSGRWFDPDLADALLASTRTTGSGTQLAATATALCAAIEPDDIELARRRERLDPIAEAFADVVDAKSPYTAATRPASPCTPSASRAAGLRARTSCATCAAPRCSTTSASSAISNTMLDKPGKLDRRTSRADQEHPRFTVQILARVPASSRSRRRGRPPRAARRPRLPSVVWPETSCRTGCSRSPTSSRR